MDLPVVWLYWVASLTIVTYASAYIIRHHREYGYATLADQVVEHHRLPGHAVVLVVQEIS